MAITRKFLSVPLILSLSVGYAAHADEDLEKMLTEAMPNMHYSCESILAEYPEDEEAVSEIVRSMVAVSLYNRGINVEEAVPDAAEREKLAEEFVERLEAECAADPYALLAGAVDASVRDALN
jgi:hypothetical protein